MRCSFSSRHAVTNTLSPVTIGDEWPVPGRAVFQRTFLVVDHCNGSFVSVDVPSPRGPRQQGQSAPCAVATMITIANKTRAIYFPDGSRRFAEASVVVRSKAAISL